MTKEKRERMEAEKQRS